MNQQDKFFLQDLAQFTVNNRLVAAQAFWEGLLNLDGLTLEIAAELSPEKPRDILKAETKKLNNSVRVQSILIAKIYAELIAAFEDFGAFCSAIYHRKKKGIFVRYLESKTSEACDFFDVLLKYDIPNQSEITLDVLLNLPPLTALTHLPLDVYNILEYDYQETPKNLYYIGQMYRSSVTIDTTNTSSLTTPIGGDWKNDINIFLGFAKPNTISTLSLVTTAFNKLKHRFMLTENLSSYGASGLENLQYARLSQEPKFVLGLLDNITQVTKLMSEVAAILIKLGELSIEL